MVTLELYCDDCGCATPRRGPTQKYCADCSNSRSLRRRADWARNNPPSREALAERISARGVAVRAKGVEISRAAARKSIFEGEPFIADEGWRVSFKFPFHKAASKNHIWSLAAGGGHIFKRKESRQFQNALVCKVREATKGVVVHQNKVWLELFVQKPHHKGDAINVIDLVADAVKIGLGVDDRWFCIKQVDWEIAKSDPNIFVSIYQRDTFDAQACSHCGRILSFSSFAKNKSNKNGVARVCLDCTRTKRTKVKSTATSPGTELKTTP